MSISEHSDEDIEKRIQIRDDLSSMTFEELMQLKEELGSKVYKEAVLGIDAESSKSKKKATDFKRLNKNRPREQSSKKQVPFLGSAKRLNDLKDKETRDPRFDEKSGLYDTKSFKENYKFLTEIRSKEINELKKQLNNIHDEEEAKKIKFLMQRLQNKNVEDANWHRKQSILKQEKTEIQKEKEAGRTPHYATKKERRAKELVQKFEELKNSGGLAKHLEKKRKKNAAKDRKKFSFD